LAVLEV